MSDLVCYCFGYSVDDIEKDYRDNGVSTIPNNTCGEHSYASKDVPIANGRPDNLDVQTAMDFGVKIKDKVTALQSLDAQMDLEVPGSFPYEACGARSMSVSPVSKENICTICGTCASVCPTEAISINESVATKIELCIRCCACIKNCPTGARVMEDSMWKNIAHWLNKNCSARKEPQIFGIDEQSPNDEESRQRKS